MNEPYCDPVTHDCRDQGQAELWERWQRECHAFVVSFLDKNLDLSQLCLELWRWQDAPKAETPGKPPPRPFCDHARDSYLTDHALLASALVACLEPNEEQRNLGRLALLTHGFPHDEGDNLRTAWLGLVLEEEREALKQAWALIDRQEFALEKALGEENPLRAFLEQNDLPPGEQPPLWHAHLAASERLHSGYTPDGRGPFLATRQDVDDHPLNKFDEKVALVYGGATKIKDYVFESARLPEVRGASSLLDRINLLDVPALWNRRPYGDRGWLAGDEFNRYLEIRQEFHQLGLDAPECLIYAGGGNFLALAPADKAAQLADAVEQIYTTQTLVAKSVAVCDSFRLIELHYGYQPWKYWLDDYSRHLQDENLVPLLRATYQASNTSDEVAFLQRKTFGQLVTILATAANRRRAGNLDAGRRPWPLPHYELLPQTIKCHSCDTRPAVVSVELEATAGQTPKVFCAACARKKVTGQVAKQDYARTDWFKSKFKWWPTGVLSWEEQFKRFAGDRWQNAEAAMTVGEIGNASHPGGYAGFIYADGNNVGALVSRIATMSAYRQFGQRMADACRQAVFAALDKYLGPHHLTAAEDSWRVGSWIMPFEILTIGGDDLTLIVPADEALDIACAIGQEFEELLQGPREGEPYRERCIPALGRHPADVEPKVGLSAGVALVRDHTPIAYVEKLADQLLKSAKKGAKALREKDYPWGTVEFAVLKSTGMVSLPWEDFRRRAYSDDAELRLTGRPYTWTEMEGLLDTVRALQHAQFPRTQIYRLQRDLLQGHRLQAAIDYLYFFGRLSKDAQKALFTHFQKAWHDTKDIPPWRRGQDENGKDYEETIWRDLVEIYDFARQREEAS
jgi:CRISPR-associated protein Cmr2